MSDEEVTFLTNGGDPNNDAVNMTMFHPKLRLLLVTTGPDGCRYYTQVKNINFLNFQTILTLRNNLIILAFFFFFLYNFVLVFTKAHPKLCEPSGGFCLLVANSLQEFKPLIKMKLQVLGV